MNLEQLLRLKNEEDYIKLLTYIAEGRIDIPERYDWLEKLRQISENPEHELVQGLRTVGRIIHRQYEKKKRLILYPLEIIVIPLFPLSKRPIINWGDYQTKSFYDQEVNKLKEILGELSILLNSAFITRHFVVIDFDFPDEATKEVSDASKVLRKIMDLETRRGFKKYFYISKYEAIKLKYFKQEGYKIVLPTPVANIEIKSGNTFLDMYPLQARYLLIRREGSDIVFSVKKYRVLSRELDIMLTSLDVERISYKIDDVKHFLAVLLRELGYEKYAKSIEENLLLLGEERQSVTSVQLSKPSKVSKFNIYKLAVVPELTYSEFIKKLRDNESKLPNCVKTAFLGTVPKGVRYYFLRFAIAVLPFFVLLTEDELQKVAEDFATRFNLSKPKLYYYEYFTGKLDFEDGNEKLTIFIPSKFGVPPETWTLFRELGICKGCPLEASCSKSRMKIVKYLLDQVLAVREGSADVH